MARIANYTININNKEVGLRWGMKFYRALKEGYGLTIQQLSQDAIASEDDIVLQADLIFKIIQSSYKAQNGAFYDATELSDFIDDKFDTDGEFFSDLFMSLVGSQGKNTDATPIPKGK